MAYEFAKVKIIMPFGSGDIIYRISRMLQYHGSRAVIYATNYATHRIFNAK